MKKVRKVMQLRLEEYQGIQKKTEETLINLHASMRGTLLSLQTDPNPVILKNRIKSLLVESKANEKRLVLNTKMCNTLKSHIRQIDDAQQLDSLLSVIMDVSDYLQTSRGAMSVEDVHDIIEELEALHEDTNEISSILQGECMEELPDLSDEDILREIETETEAHYAAAQALSQGTTTCTSLTTMQAVEAMPACPPETTSQPLGSDTVASHFQLEL